MSIWAKDRGVAELVEYFDQEEISAGGWERLAGKPDELKVVMAEVAKCRDNFRYVARNYFKIQTKERRVLPFNLWESQELLLEKAEAIKAKGKAQKVLILKARQLGYSTLIEALMAWRVMFYENVFALIVSHAPHHSVSLFDKLCLCYDSLPWWLKPMCMSRKIEEGLKFDNPNHELRSTQPGLRSSVVVQAANQLTGVGQGYTIQACHASEIADWDDLAAKQILEGDLQYALAEGPETFAFLETTAKGEGRYFHRLWQKAEEMGENSEWYPFFVPWFFERNRKVIDLGRNFHLEEPEVRIREKVVQQWLRCSSCGKFRESVDIGGFQIDGTACPACNNGTLIPYELTDNQLAWIMYKRKNASKDLESQKEFHQEMPTTAAEAFQISGVRVFPQDAMDWAQHCVEISPPIAKGFMDNAGHFHGVCFEEGKGGQCPADGCSVNHEFDDMPMLIWEYPVAGYEYTIGVDVASGDGGEGDYSVAFVNKVSAGYGPDEHVATFRSNEIDPISFAFPLAHLGTWYNEACLAIECNKYDTCFSWVRNQLQYTNLYRWKHIDSTNPNSNKWGWWTNLASRPRLYLTAIKFLKSRMWVVRSKNIVREMNHFQKDDYEDKRVEHSLGEYDDELIAGMIALYCVAPETRVLTVDLRWVPIGECAVGDKLIAFDEKIYGEQRYRCLLRESEITSHCLRQEARFEIVTDRGNVIASGHHGWATVREVAHSAKKRAWVITENLKPGDQIMRLTRPWATDMRPDSQWLAGFLDGEGCIRINHQDLLKFGRNVGRGLLSFSQKAGAALNKARAVCDELGINTRISSTGNGTNADVYTVDMRVNSSHSALEIVGRIRPVRLLENARKVWVDRPFAGWHWPVETATVMEIRPLGIGPVVSVGTTTRTFFAEGFASHNCAHDMDYDNNLGFIPIKRSKDPSTQAWAMRCMSCDFFWGANDPTNPPNCPQCFSPAIQGSKNEMPNFSANPVWKMLDAGEEGSPAEMYDPETLIPDLM